MINLNNVKKFLNENNFSFIEYNNDSICISCKEIRRKEEKKDNQFKNFQQKNDIIVSNYSWSFEKIFFCPNNKELEKKYNENRFSSCNKKGHKSIRTLKECLLDTYFNSLNK